jgi:hypothetical protein
MRYAMGPVGQSTLRHGSTSIVKASKAPTEIGSFCRLCQYQQMDPDQNVEVLTKTVSVPGATSRILAVFQISSILLRYRTASR